MGKSPGRWMKALIFGKKSSRSKYPKQNPFLVEKRDIVPVGSLDQRTESKTEEIIQRNNSQDVVCISSAIPELNAQSDSDQTREEEAVIDLQTAIRGYLARRTFQKLKGIIRLQAVIRGHLVRRQAISTLYCMFIIVKLQAVARGRKFRNSNIGVQVRKRCNPLIRMGSIGVNRSMQILKLSSNGFAQKILASSSTPLPLHFQYASNESNSVFSWLDRWSASQCWHQHLLPNPKSGDRSKTPKSHIRRSSVTNIASEFDKPIRNFKTVSSHEPVNCIEETPELVLERVKRNLRKVNNYVLPRTNDSIHNTTPDPEQLMVIGAETVIINKNEKEDATVDERKKLRRVICVPVKQESPENEEPSEKKRSVPGYMAATISAKAKLRSQDVPENFDNLTRRYSLPSSMNANISVSPMAKTTGKIKNDRSLQLSRDGSVKVNHAEWRR